MRIKLTPNEWFGTEKWGIVAIINTINDLYGIEDLKEIIRDHVICYGDPFMSDQFRVVIVKIKTEGYPMFYTIGRIDGDPRELGLKYWKDIFDELV